MALYKRGGVWWVDVYIGKNRKRVRKSTGLRDENKARIVEQSMIAVNRGALQHSRAVALLDALFPIAEKSLLKLEDVSTWYLKESEVATLSKSTIRKRRMAIDRLAAWALRCTRLEYASDVDEATTYEYMKVLSDGGRRAPKTVNNNLTDLSVVWKFLKQRARVANNPWSGLQMRRDVSRERTGRAFTKEELTRIFEEAKKAGGGWLEICRLGLDTGLRFGDCCGLKWSQIDFENRRIIVKPHKTARHGIEVGLPMTKELEEALRNMKRSEKSEYIFPKRRKGAMYKCKSDDMRFSDILAAAGVTDDGDGKWKLSFHCFRHTFVTRLSSAGVSEDIRKALAGHTTSEMNARYNHDWQGLRNAIDRMSENNGFTE